MQVVLERSDHLERICRLVNDEKLVRRISFFTCVRQALRESNYCCVHYHNTSQPFSDPTVTSTPGRPAAPPANKHKAVKENVMRPKRQPLNRPRAAARRPLRPIGQRMAACNAAVVKGKFVKPKLALTVPKTPEMMRRTRSAFKRPVKILSQEEKEDLEVKEMKKYQFKAAFVKKPVALPNRVNSKRPLTQPVTPNVLKRSTKRPRPT